MAYWWVNNNKTAKHEISGGYMWSPKRIRNNSFNQFYHNMRLVDTGDLVFAYYGQRIQYLGVIQRPAVQGNKPADFGQAGAPWSNDGWFVPVEWHRVPNPFRPKDIFSQLQPTLPEQYSPLNTGTGDGLQNVYLAEVPDAMAGVLLRQMGTWSQDIIKLAKGAGDDNGAVSLLDSEVEKTIRNNTEISETEKQALIRARRGQGRFRLNLEAIEQSCRVTGVSDSRLLRASHIKPWRSCANNQERIDGYNGFLLAPHIDHLFDRGYISFSDVGVLMISKRIEPKQLELLGIRLDQDINVGRFTIEQQRYLAFHRADVFLMN